MKKIFPVALIGCLSMLFAEVFSGASQAWFFNWWGVLLTFPLYLSHVLFFLYIALKSNKTSISQLYLFGVIFALYESWITKVLWAGYIDSTGPGLGTILGVGIQEFPILVFFWHPIMSFILPVLVFEILTQRILDGHDLILRKSTKKTVLIVVFLLLISTFIVNGNKFNLLSLNLSLGGTILIILALFYFSRKASLEIFHFRKTAFITVVIYLILLYVVTFFLVLPERIPKTITPYISIFAFYAICIYLILKSTTSGIKLIALSESHYNINDLAKFSVITIAAVNITNIVSNIAPNMCMVVLGSTYFALELAGIIIFVVIGCRSFKKSFTKNYKKSRDLP